MKQRYRKPEIRTFIYEIADLLTISNPAPENLYTSEEQEKYGMGNNTQDYGSMVWN